MKSNRHGLQATGSRGWNFAGEWIPSRLLRCDPTATVLVFMGAGEEGRGREPKESY